MSGSEQEAKVRTIDSAEIAALIERIEHAIEHNLSLTADDMKLLLSAMLTLCTLQSQMEQDSVTLNKLRKLLGMVKQSEKRQKKGNQGGDSEGGDQGNKSKKKKTIKTKKKKGKSKSTPKVVHHKMTEYQRGEQCPLCLTGKLYKYTDGRLLRITGHVPFEATQHLTEQLRCNACLKIFKANLPEDVLADGGPDQKYAYSARSLMVINKFYSGLPYYHQGTLTEIFGEYISASTLYDQCELVANCMMPVFYLLKKLAADAKLLLGDDTHNKILNQEPEYRKNRNGKGSRWRTGVYSSGLIAQLYDGKEIVLFETSLGHTGEHLDSILKNRSKKLPPPLIMSDALSSNSVTVTETKVSFCNAHARRKFVDVEFLYPKDIEWVLDTYAVIWKSNSEAEEQEMSDSERLAHHKKYSLPAMEKIKEWALKRNKSPAFQENSALGKAILYFLDHYDKLTLFCVEEAALLDNNRMEEKLKIVIRGRKTSHFYKTAIGAGVANVLLSMIATSDSASANIYEYFNALQRYKDLVKANPEDWLPWNYKKTLERMDSS